MDGRAVGRGWGRGRGRGTLIAVALAVASTLADGAPAATPDLGPGADLHGYPVFPATDPWNTKIEKAAVDPASQKILERIGLDVPLHTDFGAKWKGKPFGIPYVVVGKKQAKVPITFTEYGNESDKGPYPVPLDAPVEGGDDPLGDRHVLVLDRDAGLLYELWHAVPDGKGWKAGCGAIFDVKAPKARPAGWTSADAAGLPIFPGLVRYDEAVAKTEIAHAVRFTVRKSRRAYVTPARHFASRDDDKALLPMGARVRLKATVDVKKFQGAARALAECLKAYGMILADNGSDWFVSGAPDPRWNDDELSALRTLTVKDFEVVKMDGVVPN